jgi:4-carboxymuconolactone decarboxylase
MSSTDTLRFRSTRLEWRGGWSVTKAMTRFRHLPEVSRQIVILVVGTRFRAAYGIYARSVVARGVGVTEDQIAAITAGKRPADLSEEAQVAYDVAADMLNGGVLAEAAYQRAIGLLGQLLSVSYPGDRVTWNCSHRRRQ